MFEKLQAKLKSLADASQDSMIDTVKHIKVPPEIQEARYNICLECDKLYFPTSTCKVCGCFMKFKTWMPGQKCPLNKWDIHKVETEVSK